MELLGPVFEKNRGLEKLFNEYKEQYKGHYCKIWGCWDEPPVETYCPTCPDNLSPEEYYANLLDELKREANARGVLDIDGEFYSYVRRCPYTGRILKFYKLFDIRKEVELEGEEVSSHAFFDCNFSKPSAPLFDEMYSSVVYTVFSHHWGFNKEYSSTVINNEILSDRVKYVMVYYENTKSIEKKKVKWNKKNGRFVGTPSGKILIPSPDIPTLYEDIKTVKAGGVLTKKFNKKEEFINKLNELIRDDSLSYEELREKIKQLD